MTIAMDMFLPPSPLNHAGSTSTITIIIAAISVAGGLALILACIMCLAFMVVCCRRKSGKENIGGKVSTRRELAYLNRI